MHRTSAMMNGMSLHPYPKGATTGCQISIGRKPCRAMVKVVHFSNMAIDHHSRHRQMQYAYMLRYLWLPSKKKPLTALDKEPLLWCRHGKSHPPLLDAINGALSCEAIQEKVAEAFLHRYAVGKRTTAKFTMSSCGLL